MKKLNNLTYSDGIKIYEYLKQKHSSKNVYLRENKTCVDIYLFGKHFDTFDKQNCKQGYKLITK